MPAAGLRFRQALTYDLYLRDYIKNPPSFVRPRDREYLAWVRRFLDGEAENPRILSSYDGFVTKQLINMVYIGRFTLDIQALLAEQRIDKIAPYSIVFDYQQRNPLNHSALVTRIEESGVSLAPSS